MNLAINEFLQQQTCASISAVDAAGRPYCFSCFYVFDAEAGLLFFKSSADTYHIRLLKSNPVIAGTVLPDSLNKLVVKGIQFEGHLLPDTHPLSFKSRYRYISKYPLSVAIPGEIWTIQLSYIKFTDSSKMFGKKSSWSRMQSTVNG